MIEVLLPKNGGILWLLKKLGNGVLVMGSAPTHAWNSGVLTLDMSLNTDICAALKRSTTSCRLDSIDSSSPTARVMRPAKLFRRL